MFLLNKIYRLNSFFALVLSESQTVCILIRTDPNGLQILLADEGCHLQGKPVADAEGFAQTPLPAHPPPPLFKYHMKIFMGYLGKTR